MFGTWSIFGNNYSLESSLISLYKLCRLDEESVKCHLQASPLILSSSLGFGWASQGHSEICPKTTPVLFWLYASVIIVLKADPSSRLMMCGAFFFFKDLSVFGSIRPSLDSDHSLHTCCEKHHCSKMLPSTCFTVGMLSAG